MKRNKLWYLFLLIYSVNACMMNNNPSPESNEFQTDLKRPTKIVQIHNDHYFFDFGKAAFGTLLITMKSEQPDSLVVHLGESLANPDSIDREPDGTIRYQRIVFTDMTVNKETRLKLVPYKRNTNPPAVPLPDSFGVIMPFRYCEIENLKIPVDDIEIRRVAYHWRFNDEASEFHSSDTVLNQVWDLCKYSIKATSFAGLYVDGDRERIPYEADAFINQLSHYCVDSEYEIARRTNRYFMENPTWPTEWSLHTVLLFYYDYLYTGDPEPLSRNYEQLKYKTLMDLEREDGLISTRLKEVPAELMKKLGFKDSSAVLRDIVDWPVGERDKHKMKEINTVVNSFYYINMERMARIAGYLGKKEDSVLYAEKAEVVKHTINEKLLNREKGIYIDGEGAEHSSLHANMFPLAFGIVPEEYIPSVVLFVKSRGMACSVYGAQYLLDALYKNGEADYALELMTGTSGDRNWWNMIESGSTITLEAWDIRYKPNLDWNHAWGAAPANIISRHMWGITPVEPGYRKAQIKPQLSDLEFTSIKVPTVLGAIQASYEVLSEKDKQFIIDIPRDMEAEFVLVEEAEVEVYLNGEESTPGTIELATGKNTIDIVNREK